MRFEACLRERREGRTDENVILKLLILNYILNINNDGKPPLSIPTWCCVCLLAEKR